MSSDFRKDFKFFSEYPDLVYFDNAATTQKPDVVLEKMVKYYESENANPLRGVYDLSVKATTVYEDARERTAIVTSFRGRKQQKGQVLTWCF